MWTLLWIGACTRPCPTGSALNSAGLCELLPEDTASTDTADGATDTGGETTSGLPLSLGDPIVEVGSTYDPQSQSFAEWVDAVVISDTEAVVVGVSGAALIDIESFEIVREYATNRAYRVDADADSRIAIAGTVDEGLRRIDLDSGDVLRKNDGPEDVGHADVSIDGGVIAVAWRSEGLWLLDTDLNTLSIVDATAATAAAIRGERALYTDGLALILLDVSDPRSPAELDRTDLPAAGVDLDFDGEQVAVSLGGRGVSLYTVEGDQLTESGSLSVPGSAQGVALDGEYLWIGAWEVTALAWLGAGGPVVIGHEEPQFSAMAVGAYNGTALVADWMSATVLRRVDGLAGPELHTASQLTFQRDTPAQLSVVNHGAFPLRFSIDGVSNGYSVEPEELSIAPGSGGVIVVTPPSGSAPNSALLWSSDDPDEVSGTLPLLQASSGVGTAHDDFELLGFSWPDTSLSTHRLSDYQGKALFLAYWADY
jgi:hypothetical protein